MFIYDLLLIKQFQNKHESYGPARILHQTRHMSDRNVMANICSQSRALLGPTGIIPK